MFTNCTHLRGYIANISCLYIVILYTFHVYILHILHTSHVILHKYHVYMLCIYCTHLMLINCVHLMGCIAHIMLYSKKKKLHTSHGKQVKKKKIAYISWDVCIAHISCVYIAILHTSCYI